MTRHTRPPFPRFAACPSCGKVPAATKAEARRLRQEVEQHTGHHNEVRFYQCDTGAWHWTSQTDHGKEAA